MVAFAKLWVLVAIFLLASNANAFTSLSPVAGNQVHENHFIQFEEPMKDPTNEPSCEPTSEPIKQMDLDAELPTNPSQKKSQVAHREPKQDADLPIKLTDSINTQRRGLCHNKNQSRDLLRISLVLNKRSITQFLLQMTIPKFGKCQQQSILIPVDCCMQPP